MTRNIIGAISALDAYQLPDAKGYTAMARHLMGKAMCNANGCAMRSWAPS
ncbi:MAG: hypothetical protein R2867_21800 [Caldilineaceae bacterium]